MPEWGLDSEMRRCRPWGLPWYWLRPSKVVTDPIHKDIFLTKLEKELIDTPPFQRLRRVRQLGTTQWVYPSATHTRFAHSLGTLRAVQDLFDVAYGQRHGHHAVPDLFGQWERDILLYGSADDEPDVVLDSSTDEEPAEEQADDTEDGLGDSEVEQKQDLHQQRRWKYLKRVAEAIVLARLGALLHDVCHVPFGHSLEDDLGVLTPHDRNSWRFDRLWNEILESLSAQVEAPHYSQLRTLEPPGGDLYLQLRPLVLSKEEFSTSDASRRRIDAADRSRFPFVADMVGNTICADLSDYLRRDHTFLGLPISLGERFMSAFYVTPKQETPLPENKGTLYQQRMAVLLHREGIPRRDVVTELLKYLRYRYELQERALVHHAKVAADAMIGRMLELWITSESNSDAAPTSEGGPARVPVTVKLPNGEPWTNVDTTPKPKAKQVEDLMRRVGDDGFLERLAEAGKAPGVAELADALINRRLYKRLAQAVGAHAAEDLFHQFGRDAKIRRALESEACRYAGIEHDWHLILWLPPAEMRLKLAEMLVDHGEGIAKFVDYSDEGSEIYAAHKKLWTVSVYGHPSMSPAQKQAALARLAELMGICWGGDYFRQLGPEPLAWPTRLAALEVFGVEDMTAQVERFLRDLDLAEIQRRSGEEVDHMGLCNRLQAIARQRGFAVPDRPT